MKKLYLIGGTMGVGKTTVCRAMQKKLPHCVFLDGDWCWDMSPFVVSEETKAMVMDNICHLLQNFLRCTAYENIIFCWVMHEQSIIDDILSRLDVGEAEVKTISLIASEKAITARLEKDVTAGIRTPDVIERSTARIPFYKKLNTVKIDTDEKTVDAVAEEIAALH